MKYKMNNKRIWRSAVLVLIWLGIIFLFSSQPGTTSYALSDRIQAWISRVLLHNSSLLAADDPIFNIRKAAHVFLYFGLAILIDQLLIRLVGNGRTTGRKWLCHWKLVIDLLLCVGFAGLDELHQYFVDGRGGKPQDILVDLVGIVIALGICGLIQYKKRCSDAA